MNIFQKIWQPFCNWLKSLSQEIDTANGVIDYHPASAVEDLFQDERESRHTIRVNLAILEKEITELKRIAKNAPPSVDVDSAKSLLEEAEAVWLDYSGMFVLTDKHSKELGDVLGLVFRAMSKSNEARHLLHACH